ncbi:MAG TPA: Holliday junction resolvase RuvX, partial [Steroidobacteraceae bacterium]|nr:Holliday junction resolvase RuvX [Steroidobacteraceae bacterium]
MPEPPNPGGPRLVLAFDYGRSRIGVACGDTLTRTATALRGLSARAGSVSWSDVSALLEEWRPAAAVVGLPYNADGTEGALARAARVFAAELAGRFALRVHL